MKTQELNLLTKYRPRRRTLARFVLPFSLLALRFICVKEPFIWIKGPSSYLDGALASPHLLLSHFPSFFHIHFLYMNELHRVGRARASQSQNRYQKSTAVEKCGEKAEEDDGKCLVVEPTNIKKYKAILPSSGISWRWMRQEGMRGGSLSGRNELKTKTYLHIISILTFVLRSKSSVTMFSQSKPIFINLLQQHVEQRVYSGVLKPERAGWMKKPEEAHTK